MLLLMLTLHPPLRGLSLLPGRWDTLARELPLVDDLFDQPPEEPPAVEPRSVSGTRGGSILRSRNAVFGFTRVKPPLLAGITLELHPGEQLGLTGPSGGGKSTLVELLIGLHRPWQGEILLDGAPLTTLSREQLSREIAWIDKKPFFIPGSVRDNLLLWRTDVTEADLDQAVADACLAETIAGLPQGWHFQMSPRGANFSGGQRQRLEIARAMLGKPRILVLDEATDGLDDALEKRLRQNFRRRGIAVIWVSHRAATLAACDRTLHLVGGRLVALESGAVPVQPDSTTPPVNSGFAAQEDPVPPSRLPGDRREALAAAFRRVAAAMGVRDVETPIFRLPAAGTQADEDGLHILARYNRLPLRPVRFVERRWWRRDHGPLLAFTRDGHRPVAILPDHTGRYVIVDPDGKGALPLDEPGAMGLDAQAWMLHTRFNPDRIHPWSFFTHGLASVGADFGRAMGFTLTGALLTLGIPGAAFLLFAEIQPFADPVLIAQWQAGLLWLGGILVATETFKVWALHRLQGRLELSATSALQQHVMRLQPLFFCDHPPQEVNRSLHGVPRLFDQLQGGVLRRLLGGASGLVVLVFLAGWDPALALGVGLLWLPQVVVPLLLTRRAARWIHAHEAKRLEVGRFLFQLLQSFLRLRQAGRERAALGAWEQSMAEELAMDRHLRRTRVLADIFAALWPWAALGGFVALLVWREGWRGGMELNSPALVAALLLGFWFFGLTIQGFGQALVEMFQVQPFLDRLLPLASAHRESSASYPPVPTDGIPLQVSQLHFTYPGNRQIVLQNISLRLEPGRFVTLTGPSGSGKSTLLRLLLGFHPPASGEILRYGRAEGDGYLSAWREQVGAVLQDDRLETSMTIRGHIAGQTHYSLAKIREAARLAMLEADIEAMPMGIQTIVDSDKISTGQKQRLLIARRLLRRPRLLILDEATNALPETMQAELFVNLRGLRLTICWFPTGPAPLPPPIMCMLWNKGVSSGLELPRPISPRIRPLFSNSALLYSLIRVNLSIFNELKFQISQRS
ncbi:MAG: ATP-binding cassette domain-containing protein [Magnetococcales bacterium]|nr:ATP-binding cassette domain-containing protein [Magnetococcales bacterium]